MGPNTRIEYRVVVTASKTQPNIFANAVDYSIRVCGFEDDRPIFFSKVEIVPPLLTTVQALDTDAVEPVLDVLRDRADRLQYQLNMVRDALSKPILFEYDFQGRKD